MLVFTFGRVIQDIYLYSHLELEEECKINVCIHIWKLNARWKFVFTYGRIIPDR